MKKKKHKVKCEYCGQLNGVHKMDCGATRGIWILNNEKETNKQS